MKKLINYLTKFNIFEASNTRYLISDANEAIGFLKNIGFFEKDPTGITEDDIRNIYAFRDSKKKNSPIVAGYSSPSNFAFRRWVMSVPGIKDKVEGVRKTAFKGFHNTNLKDGGEWIPSAGDMEYVLAYAFNKINGLFKTDDENMKYVTGKGLNDVKSKHIAEFYDNNSYDIDKCVSHISAKGAIKKCENGIVTDEWRIFGGYNKNPDNTAKTDLISKDGHRISLKKLKGAQLMSGGYNEAKATIFACADYITDEGDKKMLINGMGVQWANFKNAMTVSGRRKINDPEIFKYDDIHKNITNIINKLTDKYPEFKKAIIREASTGEIKFGKNSPATADWILLWDIDIPSKTRYVKMDDYIDEVCSKQVRIYVNFKSAGSTSWSALRIETK